MKISKWCIDSLRAELIETLKSPSLPMACNDPYEWAWQVKDTDIQFVVCVEDTDFHVETHQNTTPMSHVETHEPEKVVQEAKVFKSKYLSTNQ